MAVTPPTERERLSRCGSDGLEAFVLQPNSF
jgi:hypothetical protein